MTIKQWLNRGYRINNRINELLERKRRAFEQATSATVGTDADKVQTSQRNSTEDRFVRYAAYEEMIDKEIDELYEVKLEIHAELRNVRDDVLRSLLSMRYEDFMTWEAIAERLGCSVRHIYRLHKHALETIEQYGRGEWQRGNFKAAPK